MPNLKELPDEQLMEQAIENMDCFGVLIERYEGKLLKYILRISHFSYEEAEEILQEVFLKLWKNLNEFDSSVKFSSWIYRITHNETISAFRKAKSRGDIDKIYGGHGGDDEDDFDVFSVLSSELDIEAEVDQTLTGEQIRAVLEQIPEKYREVLVLKFLEERSYEEISDILKKPSGTVATLINRAKKAFRDAWERNIQDFDSI